MTDENWHTEMLRGIICTRVGCEYPPGSECDHPECPQFMLTEEMAAGLRERQGEDRMPTEARCRAGRVISQSLADHPDSGVLSPWCDCPGYIERETRDGFVLGVYCVRKGQKPPTLPTEEPTAGS